MTAISPSPECNTSIEIRSASTLAFDQILGFYREQFPESPWLANEEYARWRFQTKHSSLAVDSSVAAVQANQVVGFMGAIPDKIWDGKEWQTAIWLVNLQIAPDFRGGLTALRMFQHVMQHSNLIAATGVGPQLLPLYQKLGWTRLQVVDTFYLVRRPSSFFRWVSDKRELNWKWKAAGSFSRLADGFARRRFDRRTDLTCPDYIVTRLDRFEEIQPLWAEQLDAHGVTTERDSDRLADRFFDRPFGKALAWQVAKNKEVRGYLIAKLMGKNVGNLAESGSSRLTSFQSGEEQKGKGVFRTAWMEIVDFVAPDQEVFDGLVRTALAEARRLDLDFVRVRCSADHYRQYFGSQRWIRKTMPVSDDVFLYSSDANMMERLKAGPWHFTSLVSDRVEYGRDEWERKGARD